ncbi:hypothetical protein BH11CYA1_BH11CYA1_02400 [soil metagenome]
MKIALRKCSIALVACSFFACGSSSFSSPSASAKEPSAKEHKSKDFAPQDFADAQRLFDQYKNFDLSNDIKLVQLYAPEAVIEAGVERDRGDVRWQKLTRDTFAKEVENSFKDEHLSSMKNAETFGTPTFTEAKHPTNGKPAIEVVFHGTSGHASVKVTWLLQPAGDGHMIIVSERSCTYSKLKSKLHGSCK